MNQPALPPRDTDFRVLLLGAGGRLGTAVAAALTSGPPGPLAPIRLALPSRSELALDPRRPHEAAARWFERWQPALVVNCIAESDVDRCEREPVHARQLNTALPAALAREARRRDARMIHFSSDFVFDGALRRPYLETDAARPISTYGHTKVESERAIRDEGCEHWVFRVSWLYGAPRGNLAADLLAQSSAGRKFRLANDRCGVPNPVQLLATEIAGCVAHAARISAMPDRIRQGDAPESGVYHLSCHGVTTWYEFGVAFVEDAIRCGLLRAADAPRLEAIAEAALQRSARRPVWSALDPRHYERCFVRTMPDWRAAIRHALEGFSGN